MRVSAVSYHDSKGCVLRYHERNFQACELNIYRHIVHSDYYSIL